MSRVITVLGIIVILGILFLLSDNKKAINKRTVGVALTAQLVLALFLIKVPVGSWIIEQLAAGVTKLSVLQMKDYPLCLAIYLEKDISLSMC